jgi:hypothetical protein
MRTKERGFTLQGAREKLRDNPEEVQRDFEIVKSLDKIRDFLLNLKKELNQPNP